MNIQDYIDVDTALSRVRGNKTLYLRMLKLFAASEDFAALDAALAENNFESAERSAHGIKGMVGNLGFTALYNTSANLNQELKSGAPNKNTLDNYYSALENTHKCVERLKEEWA